MKKNLIFCPTSHNKIAFEFKIALKNAVIWCILCSYRQTLKFSHSWLHLISEWFYNFEDLWRLSNNNYLPEVCLELVIFASSKTFYFCHQTVDITLPSVIWSQKVWPSDTYKKLALKGQFLNADHNFWCKRSFQFDSKVKILIFVTFPSFAKSLFSLRERCYVSSKENKIGLAKNFQFRTLVY